MDNRKILTPNDKPNLSKKQSYANAKHYYGKFDKYLLIDMYLAICIERMSIESKINEKIK